MPDPSADLPPGSRAVVRNQLAARSILATQALSTQDLQSVMVAAWPAVERHRLGDWVLRASSGFTGRGNSVVTCGDPGVPLRRGYHPTTPTLTMTARTAEVAAHALQARGERTGPCPDATAIRVKGPAESPAEVPVSHALTDSWFAAYQPYRQVEQAQVAVARTVLTGSPAQRFASVSRVGAVVAIGRLGLAGAWGGLAAMWVDPPHRRRGLGRAVLGALTRAAGQEAIRSMHLQVGAGNTSARPFYRGAGFTEHHAYVYLTADR